MAPNRPIQLWAEPELKRARRIQRGVQRRITGQGQEKESRADEQQEAHQLIEPAVLGRRERTQKILHQGLSSG